LTTIAPAPIAVDRHGAPLVPPTMDDIVRARRLLADLLPPTPLLSPPALAERLGCEIFLKCENLQPTGAFKVRGGLNLLSQMSPEERARGLVTASTGNHGQSIAYAARVFGAPATIYVPEGSNPLKLASVRRLGARVVVAGVDFDQSVGAAITDAAARGASFVHPANEPRLIAGVGTYVLEILDAVPDLDALIVPIGGGSGLCGACIAGKGTRPDLEVIGVQSAEAPAFHDSWHHRQLLSLDHVDTFADGLATRTAFALPAQIAWDVVDDIRLVSDAELRRAILTLLETSGMLAEGAGAAALAAAYQMRDQLAGRKVAVVLSGGNLTLDALRTALAEERPW